MLYNRFTTPQKGQALLVVILVMVVALTVGLSVATRSLTNTKLATEEENSKRAFSAAEAGVQEGLKSNVAPGTTLPSQSLGNNSQYRNVSVGAVSGKSFFLNNGVAISQDDGADIWLVPHSGDGTLNLSQPGFSGWMTIYFGNTSSPCTVVAKEPALELVLISGTNAGNASTTHYSYDPCNSRSSVNHMTAAPQASRMGVGTGPWQVGTNLYVDYYISLPISNGILMRVVPLYTNSVVLVQGSIPLPSQGNTVSSTGVYGNTQRKITAFQSFPKLPAEFFPNIIFSSQ